MSGDMTQLFWIFSIGAILVFIAGLYCLLATFNLIRAVIALELLTKAATLFIILAGYVTGRVALAQALAITLIVIEVVVVVVATGVILCVFRYNKSVNVRLLRNIKG
jgi:multisubunit Na+/H+ antiporter MnhC subunit